MKFHRLSLVLAAVLAISALPALAESSVSLLSNLPSTSAGVVVDKTNFLAQSFTVPAGPAGFAYGVAAIHVDLQKAGTGAQNSYQFKIFTNNSTTNAPLRAIGSFQVIGFTKPAFLQAGTVYTFLAPVIGTVNVVPGQTYWIVMTSSNTSTVNTQAWAPSSTGLTSAVGATLGATMMSDNQGTSWSNAGVGPLSIGIDLLTR